MKTFRPFVWDDAVAELLNVTVTVADAADAAAGNDSAATAPSATTPERGRRIKSLILDSISILSFLRGRAGKAANRHRLPAPAASWKFGTNQAHDAAAPTYPRPVAQQNGR